MIVFPRRTASNSEKRLRASHVNLYKRDVYTNNTRKYLVEASRERDKVEIAKIRLHARTLPHHGLKSLARYRRPSSREPRKNNGIKNRKTALSTRLTPGPVIRFICRNSPPRAASLGRRKQKGNCGRRAKQGVGGGVPVSRFVFTRSRANQKRVSLHPPPVDVCHNILILNRVTGSHALA